MADKLKELSVWNLASGKVDRKNRSIEGVSMCTEGEALGWGAFIDSKTLTQMLSASEAYKSGVKVQMEHGRGIMTTVGGLKNFRIEGKQLRADMSFLNSKKEEADFILEMAETMPDTFGLSPRFSGKDENIEGTFYLRCERMISCDVVDRPASNPSGFLSQPPVAVDMTKKANDATTNKSFSMTPDELKAILADALKPLSEKIVALEAKSVAVPPTPAPAPAPAVVTPPAPVPAPVATPSNVISLSQADLDAKIQAGVISAIAKAGITATGAPAPAPAGGTPPAPAAKDFKALTEEIALERKMTKGEALQFCVKNYPKEYEKYRINNLSVRQRGDPLVMA